MRTVYWVLYYLIAYVKLWILIYFATLQRDCYMRAKMWQDVPVPVWLCTKLVPRSLLRIHLCSPNYLLKCSSWRGCSVGLWLGYFSLLLLSYFGRSIDPCLLLSAPNYENNNGLIFFLVWWSCSGGYIRIARFSKGNHRTVIWIDDCQRTAHR